MIFLKRRRLVFWLFKAYLKKWSKTIVLSIALGLIFFFIIRFGLNIFIPLLPFSHQETVGMVGAYSVDDLPNSILANVSMGLTQIDDKDRIKPAAASSWEIKNGGKTYVFHLKRNLFFTDGTKLTSDLVKYNFSDVTTEKLDDYTIVYKLKYGYAPFLVTVSQPIFKKGFIGLGDYKITSININGSFVQSINLLSTKDIAKELSYQFYPTSEALKTAYVLGEISKAVNLPNVNFKASDFYKFKNTEVEKKINDQVLTTLFFNVSDKDLSDKRLREALSYAIPDNFTQGQRNYGPFLPNSWVDQGNLQKNTEDIEHAKTLMNLTASASSGISLELKTLPQYQDLAEKLKNEWKKIGIDVKIEVVKSLPNNFQVFLGEFTLPKDPDQYTLWHSDQINNITNYKNLRIDKLLEDGRQTTDIAQRQTIYADFQKYLLDDPPAVFLMFPYAYDLTKI